MARTPSGQPPANATQTYSSTQSSAPRCPRSCKPLIEPLNAAPSALKGSPGQKVLSGGWLQAAEVSADGNTDSRFADHGARPGAARPGPARPGRRGRFWMRFVAVLSHWLLVRASTRNGRSMPFRCAFCFLAVPSDSRWRVPFLCVCLFVCAPAEDAGTPFCRRVFACHSRS